MPEVVLVGNAPFEVEAIPAVANVSSHSNDGQHSVSVEQLVGG
jgi:hypothetical protein